MGSLLALLGCGEHGGEHDAHGDLPPAPPMIAPEPWSGSLDGPVIEDENPDPGVVEVTLTAAPGTAEYQPGRPIEAWTYNGTVPGPRIEADLGDRVIVHFTNDLPEPTTISSTPSAE
ncbi:MAG: multicopper oxidase domain-containing protein [Myxococcota bacterium]